MSLLKLLSLLGKVDAMSEEESAEDETAAAAVATLLPSLEVVAIAHDEAA